MSAIYPFAALRPTPKAAASVASVPYDVVSSEEARALASGNPLSFLHVSRPEIDMGAGADPHSDAAYEQAARAFTALKSDAPLVVEEVPSFYVYRLKMGSHVQSGVAACFSIDEYDRDLIKKHEKTRPDKEDDRTRHMLAIGAQTGPVFLTYRASQEVDAIVRRVAAAEPLFDLTAPDGVQHEIWQVPAGENQAIVDAFAKIEALYIADGHHRAASAARARKARKTLRLLRPGSAALGSEADRVLAVAFPDNQMQVLPYNRVVKDLNGMTPESFLKALEQKVPLGKGVSPMPMQKGQVAMYLGGEWHTLHLEDRGRRAGRRRARDRDPPAAAGHHGRAHRQAHRFRRRHPRHAGARAAGELRRRRRGVFDVSGLGEGSDAHLRCRRHHAAEVDLVRAEASRRTALALDLIPTMITSRQESFRDKVDFPS